jgi:DNA-binding CsgD family transcriptional regulator
LVAMGLLTWLQTWNSEARPQLEQALTIARAHSDKRNAAEALGYLGLITYLEGNSAEAQACLEECRALFEEMGDNWGVASALWRLGWVVADIWKLDGKGNQENALALYEQSLALFQECGDQYQQSLLLRDISRHVSEKREWARAQTLLREALTLAQHVGSKYEIANTLGSMAGIQQAHPANSVRLLGAATKIFQSIGASATSQAWVERDLAKLRTQLDNKIFGAAFADGYALTLAQAIAEAHRIMIEPDTSAPSAPALTYPAGLTAREVEVLRLLAMGLTNQEIADQLVLSRRTVHAHLRSIYSKLDVTTRNAATRAAIELKLA